MSDARLKLRSDLPRTCLTLDEQVEFLKWVMKLIGYCRGNTSRDVNRAVYLAAQAMGIHHKRLLRMMKLATIKDARYAVEDAPNEITVGQGCGYVYFAITPDRKRFKIGFSHEPSSRISVVSHITGIPLVEIHRKAGLMLNEHVFHVLARPAWLGGEWYDADLLLNIPHFSFLPRLHEVAA